MKKFLIICMSLLAFSLSISAQESVNVTGVVVDANNEPLPGVSVSVLDMPGLGTMTDSDGKYAIKVQRYRKLVFTYIGFDRQEVLVNEQQVINITMAESESNVLKDVVVTGTGVQTKQTLTGAITTVDVETLKSNPSGNISNALAGNVPGVMAMARSGQPGKNTSEFWIRGISTFGAGSSALVLVDGFERELDEINIEDIESFSVLKDASVTAIYGSKGANGVILITTKRGKAGKINIDVKLETTYNTRTTTPEFVDGATYASLLNESRITRNFEPVYQPEELEILRLGLDPDLYPNVDWKDLLLKDGAMTYRANLNMNGGGTTARYYVSASYIEEGGMYKTDKTLRDDYDTNANYKRWNYRLNTDIDITSSTILKVGVSGSLSKRNSPGLGDGDVWASLFGYSPIRTPVMYSNGYVPAIGTGGQTNPWVLATQTGFNENWNNNIETNVSLEQNFDFITKGLRFLGKFGFDTRNSSDIRRLRWPEQWLANRSRDPETGELIFKHVSNPQEMKQESGSSGIRKEFLELMLNYDRNFNGHNVGGALRYTRDAETRTADIGTDIKNGVSKRNQGLAGRVTYNWQLRYFADFNFGYTGSENFASGKQYGFFPAFSLGWNIAEEKPIKDNLEWMNMFKVRYSWGKVGNDNIGDRFPFLYTINSTYRYRNADANVDGYTWSDVSGANGYGFTGMRYHQVASPKVTWEVSTKNNLGFDLSLFGDKIQANIDFFHEKRTGIYMRRNYLPDIVGLEWIPEDPGNANNGNLVSYTNANVGAVKSKGFDGQFAYKQKAGDVNLTVRGNMTYSKNEVLERDEENNIYAYQQEKGYRVDQCRGLIAMGLFKDYDDIRNSPTQTFGTVQPGDIKYKDVNGDGIIDDGDRVAIGATRRPNLIYGLGVSASWKGLDINVHFQGAGKSTFFTYGKTVYAFSEGEWGTVLKDIMGDNRWISAEISGDPATEDPNASYPRLSFGGNSNNYRESTYWLRNGQYLRLKTVDIGYTLPKHIVNKLYCNNIRVFLVGSNLLTWSKFKLWDPELASSRGEEYPLAKSVTLGLSINL